MRAKNVENIENIENIEIFLNQFIVVLNLIYIHQIAISPKLTMNLANSKE